jgi:hypothetical protein
METTNKQRPRFITMFCSFYFVYWAISIVSLIAALLIRIGGQFPAFSDIASQINLIFLGTQVNVSLVTWLIAVGLLVSVIGYWFLQKWAVIVYAASSVALFIVALPSTASAPTKTLYFGLILYVLASVFALNIAMIVVGILNFKRMK